MASLVVEAKARQCLLSGIFPAQDSIVDTVREMKTEFQLPRLLTKVKGLLS